MKHIFRALPAYFGGKRKIIDQIFNELPPTGILVDPMGGAMTIPLAAKQLGYSVKANDRSPGSQLIAAALLLNEDKVIDLTLIDSLLEINDEDDAYVSDTYGDFQLPDALAAYADTIHNRICDNIPDDNQSVYFLLLYRWLTMMAPYNLYRYPGLVKGFINNTYPTSMQKHIDRWNVNIESPIPLLTKIAGQINEAVCVNADDTNHTISGQDVFDFLDNTSGDILYLDPPYAGAGIPYEKGYDVINYMITRGNYETLPVSDFNDVKNERAVLTRLLIHGLKYDITLFSYWTELHDADWFEELFEELGFEHTNISLGNYSYSYSTKKSQGKDGKLSENKAKGQKEILYKLTKR